MVLIEEVGSQQTIVVIKPDTMEAIIPEGAFDDVLGADEYTMEMYLESETHERLVQTRIRLEVLEKFPHLFYDSGYMETIADTSEGVRDKFDNLRSLNMELEAKRRASHITRAKGRNIHYSELITFMLHYNYALRQNKDGIEYQLTLKLGSILNKELGNLTDLGQIPNIFIEGVGKGAKLILDTTIDIIKDTIDTILDEILPKDWKKWLIIIGVVIVGIIILGLIGYSYTKSYVGAKAIKRATK